MGPALPGTGTVTSSSPWQIVNYKPIKGKTLDKWLHPLCLERGDALGLWLRQCAPNLWLTERASCGAKPAAAADLITASTEKK